MIASTGNLVQDVGSSSNEAQIFEFYVMAHMRVVEKIGAGEGNCALPYFLKAAV